MHFSNNRNYSHKLRTEKAPCPYHSRVSNASGKETHTRSLSDQTKAKKSRSLRKSTQLPKQQQNKLPKILSHKSTQSQPLIDPEYQQFGGRILRGFDYYQDYRLSNEGWPSNPFFGKVKHARYDDVAWKAKQFVNSVYNDEFYSVRQQLEIINRIKQRRQVLENIEQDKQRLKHLVKQMRRKKVITDYDDSAGED